MADNEDRGERTRVPGEEAGEHGADSTLLPMLIVGLVLIVLGALLVMSFV